MTTLNQRIAKAGGVLIGTHPAGSQLWHEQRAYSIGGSDIAPIMNLSPWTSALSLWAEKCGKLLPKETTMAMRLGNYFEPGIVKLFGDIHPRLNIHTGDFTFAAKDNPFFHANPDAIIEDEDGNLSILEIKFSRNVMNELPEHYRLQVLWYQIVTGLHSPAVVCAVAGGEYREFTVDYDQSLAEDIKEAAKNFLELVANDTEPKYEGSNSTYETVRALHPDIEDIETEIVQEDYEALTNALDWQKVYEQQVRLRKSLIMNQLEGARYGTVNGKTVVMLQSRGEGKPFLKITGE